MGDLGVVDNHNFILANGLVTHNSGKTLCGLFEGLTFALKHAGSVGYIFEPTYPMVKRNLIPTLESDLLLGHPFTDFPYVHSWNWADMKLTFTNGSVIWFMSLEEPERAEGGNIDWAMVDEGRLVRHFRLSWEVILRRLRGSGNIPRDQVRAWVTTTPDKPGSDLFQIFEDPRTKLEESRVYRWSIFDNPHLTQKFIREIVRTHTGGLAERFIYGRFAEIAAGSFAFDTTVHVVKDPPPRSAFRRVVYGVDFGWTNPSAIIVTGYDGDGRAWALDEFYQTEAGAERIVNEALALISVYGRGTFYCDRSEPETIAKMKLAGINAEPYPHKREEGLRELGSRFQKAGDGRPRIYISARCVNLISELLEYRTEVKERDHACLSGESLVTTSRGDLPMREVNVGDWALTRKGWRRVTASACTGFRRLYELSLTDGRTLKGTRDHRLIIDERPIRIDALGYLNKPTLIEDGNGSRVQRRRESGSAQTTVSPRCSGKSTPPTIGIKGVKPVGWGLVYNITVEDAHEFYANGVLVKNCDALRYSIELHSKAPLGAFRFG